MQNNKRFIKGKLYLNDTDRLALKQCKGYDYEFHCGKWLSTRIEADHNDIYYAVGLHGLPLEGVMARVPERW